MPPPNSCPHRTSESDQYGLTGVPPIHVWSPDWRPAGPRKGVVLGGDRSARRLSEVPGAAPDPTRLGSLQEETRTHVRRRGGLRGPARCAMTSDPGLRTARGGVCWARRWRGALCCGGLAGGLTWWPYLQCRPHCVPFVSFAILNRGTLTHAKTYFSHQSRVGPSEDG